MASPKYMASLRKGKNWFQDLYREISSKVVEWVLLKTASYRLKRSKKIILSSIAYCSDNMMWDDIDVLDEKGRWLPFAFGLCSRKAWEAENELNKECGFPTTPWQDVIATKDWTTYYVNTEVISIEQRVAKGREHLKKTVGELIYSKDIEVRYTFQSQSDIDKQKQEYEQWCAKGRPPFKVVIAESCEQDLEKLLGPEEAQQLFKSTAEWNAEISEQNLINDITKDNINKVDGWEQV